MSEPQPTTQIWGLPPRPGPSDFPDTDPGFFVAEDLDKTPPTDEELANWNEFGLFVRLALRTPTEGPIAEPESVGSFRVVRILGTGGNGTVYLAQDHALPRVVAVKVPHGDLLRLPGTRERFMQEARLVAGLKHPNIVEIHQIGEEHGLPFLVFEYCEGGSLSEWLSQRGEALSPRSCAEIVRMLANAVQQAHSHGVLHRDLNPRNVLLVPDRSAGEPAAPREFPFVVKLSDFGLGMLLDNNTDAVHTQTGTVVGTIPYMAPEQTSGTSRFLQPGVDVHALGVILFELLTRRRPYIGATPLETLRMIQDAAPPMPRSIRKNIPRDLETICLKCLEKAPQQRYGSAQLLADDLDRFLTNRPILAHRASIATRAVQWMVRHPLVATLTGIICLLTGLLGAGSYWYSARLAMSLRKTGELQSQTQEHQELIQSMAYAGQIRRAQELLEAGYDHAAGQLLRNWIPVKGEPDRRKFEWYYLLQASGGEMTPLPRYTANNGSLYSAAPSRDGRFLFVGAPGCIEKWDVNKASLDQILRLPGKSADVRDLAVDGRGDIYFARGELSGIYRWSSSLGAEMRPFCQPADGINFCNRIILTPDQRNVISLTSTSQPFHPPSRIRFHDAATGKLIWEQVWLHNQGFDVAFDAHARQTIILINGHVIVLNDRGVAVQDLHLNPDGPNLSSLAVSPDGQWLAISALDYSVPLFRKNASGTWESAGELPLPRRPAPPEDMEQYFTLRNPLTFVPGGTRLFTANDTQLHLWDVARRVELQSMLRLPRPVRALKLLPDGQTVAWGSASDLGLWRPQIRQPSITGHSKETWSVAFSPDGKWMASGSDDETVKIWDVASGRELHTLSGHVATISAVAFSPDGRRLASASLDQTIRIWNVDQPETFQVLSGHQGTVRCLSWSADGLKLLSGDRNRPGGPTSAIVWDVGSKTPARIWQDHQARIRAGLFLKDGRRVITVSEDNTAMVRDVESGKVELILRDNQELHSAALLKNDQWLATGNKLGIICIWDLRTGELVKELRGHAVSVRSLALSPDARVLASGSEDSTVRIWDPLTGECLLVLRGHQAPVNSVAFSPNGELLASGAHDGTVKLWHAPRFER